MGAIKVGTWLGLCDVWGYQGDVSHCNLEGTTLWNEDCKMYVERGKADMVLIIDRFV